MNQLLLCLRQIEKINDVAGGNAFPYVARSRIGRLIVGLNTLAEQTKNPNIEIFGVKIQTIAKTICQPSEPLDERWRAGWTGLKMELNLLEQELKHLHER